MINQPPATAGGTDPDRTQLQTSIVVLRPSFDPELKWNVVYKGRETPVTLADDVYINRVIKGEEVFGAGDVLEVDLQITQIYERAAKVYIDKSYKM